MNDGYQCAVSFSWVSFFDKLVTLIFASFNLSGSVLEIPIVNIKQDLQAVNIAQRFFFLPMSHLNHENYIF